MKKRSTRREAVKSRQPQNAERRNPAVPMLRERTDRGIGHRGKLLDVIAASRTDTTGKATIEH
jgi:hypothetical protein